jgi:CheY-like chemotaxis protein
MMAVAHGYIPRLISVPDRHRSRNQYPGRGFVFHSPPLTKIHSELPIVRFEVKMSLTQNAAVLYVEDEYFIREIVGTALGDAGFDVVVTASGAAACDALDENAEHFRMIVTDVNLGDGPDGWEVARHARVTNHAMSVIYTSGASANDRGSNAVPNSVMIVKPFTTEQLVVAMCSLIRHEGD